MIAFKDLSKPLKIATIAAYISGSLFAASFVYGFVQGLLGGV